LLTLHGARLIWRRPAKEESRIRGWIARNDFLSIFVASLLPPPTPFKVFAVIAGGMRTKTRRFIAALFLGRGLRFAIEAWLGAYYGVAAQAYLRRNVVWLSVATAAAAVILAVVYRLVRRTPRPS
jgi:membrane protein YqaA with SNARE-associated domain